MTKNTFSRSGKSFGSSNTSGNAFKNLNSEDLNKLISQGLQMKQRKNLFLAQDLNDLEKISLHEAHLSNLNDKLFQKFKPRWSLSKKDALALQMEEEIANTMSQTDRSYRVSGMDNIDIEPYFTLEKHIKLLCLYDCIDSILEKDKVDVLGSQLLGEVNKPNLSDDDEDYDDVQYNTELNKNLGSNMSEAIKEFSNQGKIVSVLKEAQSIYADVAKLADKYSIRIGDGKHFVASDNVKITMRDPSENPAWAIWFLDAVPLKDIPDRAKLVFVPEDEREQFMPKIIPDRPIVCHASLWNLGQTSGVLLHTSWNHISVSYSWHIDKPIEVASLLFKAVSHPAHIARNFGYAPQLKIPGGSWF